jgi:hypothetical protein
MSDIPSDWRGQIDLRAVLTKIDRDRAETQKLFAESHKFNREPWVLVLAALIAALAALIARLPEILHAMGLP